MNVAGARVAAAVVTAAAVVLVGVVAGPWSAMAVGILFVAGLGAVELAGRARRRLLQQWLAGDDSGAGSGTWQGLEEATAAVVAERDQIREEIARLEPWRTRLVASIEGPALLFSADERLMAANPAACELLGIPAAVPDLPLAQALGSSSLANTVREAGASGRPVQVDVEVRGRDLRATASAVAEEILVIVADRTEQRRVEELRRNFVVNASHELKTPATSIQALSEALQIAIGSDSPRTPALADRLHEESQRLVLLVHDLLDLRRLEDPGPLERVPVDLVRVVRDVLDDVEPAAAEAEVVVAADLPASAHVAGVPEDLHVAVHNLVANAVRYNEPGGRAEVSLRREGGDHVLTVRDTGIGIPQDDLQRVFERFYRVDVARSRERGGTGLGLSLVRNAVERHGGGIEVESLLGSGSTFTVRLPIDASP